MNCRNITVFKKIFRQWKHLSNIAQNALKISGQLVKAKAASYLCSIKKVLLMAYRTVKSRCSYIV